LTGQKLKQNEKSKKVKTISPVTQEILNKYDILTKEQINEFIERFVHKTEKLKVGDPMLDETDMGPLVNETVKEGAELLTGGERTKNKGYFYRPTIIKNVSPKMRIAEEEVFGPVAPIIIADGIKTNGHSHPMEEAIKLANDTQYGLGASIWTQDLEKAERLSRLVSSGIVSVNNVVASAPRIPFGGVKKSGFGRELSRYGMLEFVNIKSVRFYDQLVHHHHVE
jgi:acyl-CoA reductase-like NAD-dependent aldehyde dehydrogenase